MDIVEQVYLSLTGELVDPIRYVPNAFEQGSYCAERYQEMLDAYERLRERLGVTDEDEDVEIMISAFEDIQQKLCLRMYHYGARFGE